MSDRALVVFTYKSRQHLLDMGGTASWSLNPTEVRKCRYVVCTRNTDPNKTEEGATEPHGAAFLVGRIAGLKKVYREKGRQRYKVLFDAVAHVLAEGIWDGSRTPTRYVPLDELANRGLDIESLPFVLVEPDGIDDPVPADAAGEEVSQRGGRFPLTIAEAKRGLALKFDVAEDDIEIVIKG